MLPRADGLGRVVVMARVGTIAPNTLVGLVYQMSSGELPDVPVYWSASRTPKEGGGADRIFEMIGVTLSSGHTQYVDGGFGPVAVFGPVKNVTLPGNVTRTQTNSALVRNGTRDSVLRGLVAGSPNNVLSVADITDSKTGAANGRDLFLYGKNLILDTLFRSTGRVKDNTGPLSQSMLMDGYGNGYLMVDCSTEGVTEGQLTMFRRGGTSSWKPVYNGNAIGAATANRVFIYGVPTVTVSAATGATARVQVFGHVNATLQTAISIASGDSLRWNDGGSVLTFTSNQFRWWNLALADYGAARTLTAGTTAAATGIRINLLGRIFNN